MDNDDTLEFDKHRETLLTANTIEGWVAELRHYLSTMQWDVTKNTDLIEWWQVRHFFRIFLVTHIILWNNTTLYPMLACIVLDVLPSQASSVPCGRLFSGSKQIATDRWACLGSTVFEQLVIMGSAWRPDLYDMAAWTALQQEEVEPFLKFEEMLDDDNASLVWDQELDMEGNCKRPQKTSLSLFGLVV